MVDFIPGIVNFIAEFGNFIVRNVNFIAGCVQPYEKTFLINPIILILMK